jgi:hypothetical protein
MYVCCVKQGKVNYKYSNLLENRDKFRTFWPVIHTSGILKELIWLYNNLYLWKQQTTPPYTVTLVIAKITHQRRHSHRLPWLLHSFFLCDITVVLTVRIHPNKAVKSQPPVCLVTMQIDRYYPQYISFITIPVSVRSKAWVCGHSLAEIVGSNPAGGMNVSC